MYIFIEVAVIGANISYIYIYIYTFYSLRWLKTFNIKTASLQKQRVVANAWSGDDLVSEFAPLMFPATENKNKREMKLAPWAYVSDLPGHIIKLLTSLNE